MIIKVTKKQNVKVDGVKYRAVDCTLACAGCAFTHKGIAEACDDAPCCPGGRVDNRSVIFVLAPGVAK